MGSGEGGGEAIADVLLGVVNPSGKLPETFPRRWEDSPAYGHYPGTDGVVAYDEGLYVGYRHFDRARIEPMFPFGHGLSYTKFEYSNLAITPPSIAAGQTVTVKLNVKHTGPRAGAEVVQLYIHPERASVDRPVKELKSFRRVDLQPGETKTIEFAPHEHFKPPGLGGWLELRP